MIVMRLSTFRVTVVILLFTVSLPALCQTVPEPVSNAGIYSFIDELAAAGIVDINQAVRPYSRKTITDCLQEASLPGVTLSRRQQKELDLYLEAYGEAPVSSKVRVNYNPASLRYRDSLFTITAVPLLGLSGSLVSGDTQTNAISWYNGARVYGSYGRWSFFASLQDNHQDPLTGRPEYLTRERGGHIKGGTDFSEMKGGIGYEWKWGDISFLKDAPVWGSGYAGTNILSGRAPSFMQVRLHLRPVKWAEMTWFHGWLNSMVVDSARSFWVTNAYGTDYREVYHTKYIAANIFTITPVKGLHLSAGNSVIYSDSRLTPYYLMPLFFYKSVDHGINSGIDNSNSQMFLDVSSRNIPYLHLYGTLFIDELSTSRFTTSDYNFFSWKGGMRTGNFPFLPDLWLTAEGTFTYPLTYQHYVPVLTFENQGYNLGHWLRDNSRSWYLSASYRPVRGMNITLWHEWSERGPDYQSLGGPRVGLPYLNPVEWKNSSSGLKVVYLVTGEVQATLSVTRSNITGEESWTAPWLYGKTTSLTAGLVWGFF